MSTNRTPSIQTARQQLRRQRQSDSDQHESTARQTQTAALRSLDNVPLRTRAPLARPARPAPHAWDGGGDSHYDGSVSSFDDTPGYVFRPSPSPATQRPFISRQHSTETLTQASFSSSWLSSDEVSRTCSPTPSELDALEELAVLDLDDLSLAASGVSVGQVAAQSQRPESPDSDEGSVFYDASEVSSFSTASSDEDDDAADDATYRPSSSEPVYTSSADSGDSTVSARPQTLSLAERLPLAWPNTPSLTGNPPIVALWELTRIALHCKVADPSRISLTWHPAWKDLDVFWAALKQHPVLSGKRFPPKSDPQAWLLGVESHQNNNNNNNSAPRTCSSTDRPTPLRAVVLTASMHPSWNSPPKATNVRDSSDSPPLRLELNPLIIEKSSRLLRHFGWDRFLEVRIPSLETWPDPSHGSPSSCASEQDEQDEKEAIAAHWLARKPHHFMNRQWAAFYVRDQPFKVDAPEPSSLTSNGPVVPDSTGSATPKAIYYHRVLLFAEQGADLPGLLKTRSASSCLPSSSSTSSSSASVSGRWPRTALHRNAMLGWLLNWEGNVNEPYLKLFQRIALGLSRTTPTILLEPSQIVHRFTDMLSPCKFNQNCPDSDQSALSSPKCSASRTIMNDGAGRISPRLMQRVRDELGLQSIPSAIQARLGSAKGMWVIDATETDTQAEWIETYPSQRKWKYGDGEDATMRGARGIHEAHRTLEVISWSADLTPASLNIQFLPILDDRARDKKLMWDTVTGFLVTEAEEQTKTLLTALQQNEVFRKWVHDQTRSNIKYLGSGPNNSMPFLGGLPQSTEDAMSFLADGGFSPMQLKFLQTLVFQTMKSKGEKMKQDLKIRVSRSTYAYIIPDFWGVLEPGEVHLSFSAKFNDGVEELSDLDGRDVLVARSPAHLPSDVQKVRATFKSALRHLRDVVIFSTKGEMPLASILSGGDYDGDKVLICWDPVIVDNFKNYAMPPKPKKLLAQYIRKDCDKLVDLRFEYGTMRYIDVMLEKAFRFNLTKRFLGPCTIYKEKLAYHRFSASSPQIISLSWLLSELADQPKQGIIFGRDEWARFQSDILGTRMEYPVPAYKRTPGPRLSPNAKNIIDHVMFEAKTVVEASLAELYQFLDGSGATTMDDDVVGYWNAFEAAFGDVDRHGMPRCGWFVALQDGLQDDVEKCITTWSKLMMGANRDPDMDYNAKVKLVYADWREIQPRFPDDQFPSERSRTVAAVVDVARKFLTGDGSGRSNLNDHYSQWELLKASWTFKHFHHRKRRFIWQMAGRQLQVLKALATTANSFSPLDSAPFMVAANMYSALKPDNTYIKRLMAMEGDEAVGHPEKGEEEEEDREDDLNGLDEEVLLWEASQLSQEE
ncbi:RNA dependent RNA polymerase-domain-containing protein [Coniella lustricola]|uniref:RNA-dependent RNA polymerase n=1 Tax=Coniella lustricola TaxID=2025994 RepID=A0A2T3A7Y2_9PEZI|nr:RNA dependent RNA polymerase-domain-containing protein [Coniella lustricola]